MKRTIILLAVLALIAYTAFGINYLVTKQHKIELNEIQLKSQTTELKQLQVKYDQLNSTLDKELHNSHTDQQKVKELETEKQQLEKQKIELEQQLQARLEAKRLAAERQQELANKAINTVTRTATASASPAGDKYALMAAAGIPASDYAAVDYIISHESSWRPGAVNASSGATGLCQSLPASKMASAGSDYLTNPVTQLKWCHSYAQQRYGGWSAAQSFWSAARWW